MRSSPSLPEAAPISVDSPTDRLLDVARQRSRLETNFDETVLPYVQTSPALRHSKQEEGHAFGCSLLWLGQQTGTDIQKARPPPSPSACHDKGADESAHFKAFGVRLINDRAKRPEVRQLLRAEMANQTHSVRRGRE